MTPVQKYQASEKGKAKRKSYYENNKDKFKAYKQANKERAAESAWKSRLKIEYNLTIEQYNSMLTEQSGGCKICLKPDEGRKLAVDHCHSSGKVRGLLCNKCNRAIGLLNDSVDSAERLYIYLKDQDEATV